MKVMRDGVVLFGSPPTPENGGVTGKFGFDFDLAVDAVPVRGSRIIGYDRISIELYIAQRRVS